MHRARDSDPDALGAVLLGRDVASVVADREGGDGELRDEMDDEELDGYRASVRSCAHAPVVWSPRAGVGFPQQVLRSCRSHAYQSEQDGAWGTSEARRWFDAIITAVVGVLTAPLVADGVPAGTDDLSHVPGVEDAHWSYERGLEERTKREEQERSDAATAARQRS